MVSKNDKQNLTDKEIYRKELKRRSNKISDALMKFFSEIVFTSFSCLMVALIGLGTFFLSKHLFLSMFITAYTSIYFLPALEYWIKKTSEEIKKDV